METPWCGCVSPMSRQSTEGFFEGIRGRGGHWGPLVIRQEVVVLKRKSSYFRFRNIKFTTVF